ncbi:lipopolysaccharide core heptose(II) kinase RfaY [Brenneria tiliae]|uniref:Lipopolysaccharide core biosynthesis protein n=1 Tax=Brenneria tiliae TaxID=2914984 RepID=A0ABT0MY12_9GAMM|nr:lipopolysaccharide core heptose(II) kinase RfaY [Brenneria tiliae]MCL2894457.1 lipopolysaccharide core biosynthesis protein [Brenneria tiliae]
MPEIIIKREINGFHVYEKSRCGSYVQILADFCAGKIDYKFLNSGSEERKVYLIEVKGIKYVLKWERELDPRLEKRLSRFIFGPYYSKLMYRVAVAREQGCTKTADIYAVAEKVRHREAVETYILAEYVEGRPLAELGDFSPYKNEIKACVEDLHDHRLASNDIHPGNIILTDHGLRIIDLSDAGSLSICQVNDAFALKKFYDIDLRINNVIYYLIGLRNRFRDFSRKLRGKKH